MSNKLYVGNLSYNVTTTQLEELFKQVGTVISTTIITDRTTGRSKGFGFIEMENEEKAKKAIEMFNGKDFEGRRMIVNEARPPKPKSNRY